MKDWIKKNEILIVISLAFLTVILSSLTFISQLTQTPEGHVFVGLSHYWEDFYYYLDQFYQGSHGVWLTINRFSIETFTPTLLYFNHILLGKIGGLFGLASFESYNISALLLKFFFVFSAFISYKKLFPKSTQNRLLTLLLFLFSTSLPLFVEGEKGLLAMKPSGITRTAALFEERFGNMPYTLMSDMLFPIAILLIVYLFDKTNSKKHITITNAFQYLLLSIVVTLISIAEPAKTIILLITLTFLILFRFKNNIKKAIQKALPLLLSVLIPAIVVAITLSKSFEGNLSYEHVINWTIQTQASWSNALLSNPFSYVHTFGILLILFLVGIVSYIRRKNMTSLEQATYIVVLASMFFYHFPIEKFIPIPRFRFLFPATYIYMAPIALYGMQIVLKRINKKNIIVAIVLGITAINLTTILVQSKNYTQRLEEPYFHFAYLPNDLYIGYKQLEALPQEDVNVLGGPHSSMDIMIPGLSGKRTYSGHNTTTYNNPQKDEIARSVFFEVMSESELKVFLNENNIQYIFYTVYDGNVQSFKAKYPSLASVFENSYVSIFSPRVL